MRTPAQPQAARLRERRDAIGLFSWIKHQAQRGPQPSEEPSEELGDFVEPGSSPVAFDEATSNATGLGQLEELRASGLIDADTFQMIEASMTNATAQLDQLHASGMMSDEIYAQAMASMTAATSGSQSVNAAELELLQSGESAPATILALQEPSDEPSAQRQVTLEVHPATGSAFTAQCAVAAVPPGAELKAGNFLGVKFDPDDPQRLAIDWSGFDA